MHSSIRIVFTTLICVMLATFAIWNWLLGVILFVSLIVWLMVIKHYKYGIYLTILLLPIGKSASIHGYKVLDYELMIAATTVCFFFQYISSERKSINPIPYKFILGTIIAYLFMNTVFISINQSKSILQLVHFMEGIVLFVMTLALIRTDRKEAKRIIFIFIAASLIQSAIGIYQHYTGALGATHVSNRGYLGLLGVASGYVTHAVGTFGTFNVLASYLSLSLCIMLPILISRNFNSRLLLVGFLVVLSGFVFTYSRGALLGMTVATAAILYRKISRKKFIICMIIASAAAGFMVHKALAEKTVHTKGYEDRQAIWQRVEDVINTSSKNYFFGTGANTYRQVVQYPATVPAAWRNNWFAHNQHILYWQEFGLVGLVLFSLFMLMIIYRNGFVFFKGMTGEASDYRIAVTAAALLIVTHGFFEHQFALTHFRNQFFILLAIAEA